MLLEEVNFLDWIIEDISGYEDVNDIIVELTVLTMLVNKLDNEIKVEF